MLKAESGDDNRWREKYFAQGEEFEQQAKTFEDYIHLLQRALVRISLAADGQDDELDKLLSDLRSMLRKANPSVSDISSSLSKVENALLRLDKAKESSSTAGLGALQALINQLLEMDLSRANKKSLKTISKALKTQGNDLKAYPHLLNEYAQVQQRAISESLQKLQAEKNSSSDTADSGGFLNKLFGSKPETSAPSVQDDGEQKAEVANDLSTENNFNASPITPKQGEIAEPREASHSEAMTASSPEEEVAAETKQFEKPAEEVQVLLSTDDNDDRGEENALADMQYICERLASLIEHLAVPETEQTVVEHLQNKIANGIDGEEAGQIIDELAQLVIKSVEQGQQDFELFLQTLDQRLLEINGFLGESEKTETQWRSASQQFDQTMRSQVGSISSEVMDATDLDLLKSSVQNHLDSITDSMDQLAEAEKQRESGLSEQVVALQERLTLMENESSAIKKRLHLERIKALTDVLTGLPNREAFDERLMLEWERFQRYKKPVVLAVLDIDHFKRVNDTYGHLVGDKVLQAVSKAVQKLSRKTDFFARFGGEEFVIIMPETKLEGAVLAANKIREEIEKLPLSSMSVKEPVTVSFGLVNFRKGASIEALFELADKALYQAKNKGRNRVEVAE